MRLLGKIAVMLTALVMTSMPLAARDVVTRDASVLPDAARKTLTAHFPKVAVHHIKIDKKTFGGADYDVILADGTEIEFNSEGHWTEIDCGSKAVPSKMLLPAISDYVARNFKGRRIVGVEVSRSAYEVELSDGTDLEFDRSGAFLKVDD